MALKLVEQVADVGVLRQGGGEHFLGDRLGGGKQQGFQDPEHMGAVGAMIGDDAVPDMLPVLFVHCDFRRGARVGHVLRSPLRSYPAAADRRRRI